MTEHPIVTPQDDSSRTLKFYCHICGQKLDATGLTPFSKILCPACEGTLIVPAWFENYLLEEPVGQGGMATVYRALDIALDREVAIKLLDKSVLGENIIDIFLHEARTAATINHYAIIPIYTCGMGAQNDQAYIVMQYMNGGSLDDILESQQGLLPPVTIAQWIHDVAEGLECAARHGIVHHDVKPGNIMLDADGRAKIGDFGIANSVKSAVNEMVREKFKSWVTPNYVSPEKVLYQEEDFRGDIYSLGATFFHMLTNRPPFIHHDVNELAMLRTVMPAPTPISIRPDTPKILNDLIMNMLHLNPLKRPTYPEICATLKKYMTSTHQREVNAACAKKTFLKNANAGRQLKKKSSVGLYALLGGAILLMIAGYGLFAFLDQKFASEKLTPAVYKSETDSGVTVANPAVTSAKPTVVKPVEVPGYLPNPVTAQYLLDIHSYPASRPHYYPGFELKIDPEQVSRYMDAMVPGEREREKACMAVLDQLKPDLIKMMQNIPYRQSSLMLRGAKKPILFNGALNVKDAYLSVPIGDGRYANHAWDKLTKTQFETFLRHYAKIREESGDPKEAAAEYVKIAVYLDWIGEYESAAATLEKAFSLDPELRKTALKWFSRF